MRDDEGDRAPEPAKAEVARTCGDREGEWLPLPPPLRSLSWPPESILFRIPRPPSCLVETCGCSRSSVGVCGGWAVSPDCEAGGLIVANDELEAWLVMGGGTNPLDPLRVLLLTFVVAGTFGGGDIALGGGDEALCGGRGRLAWATGAASPLSLALATAAATLGISAGLEVAPLTLTAGVASKGEGSRTSSRRLPWDDGSCLSALPSLLCNPLSRCLGYACLSGLGGRERLDSVSESEMSS